MEDNFRRAMTLSHGHYAPFFARPFSLVILGCIALTIVVTFMVVRKAKVAEKEIEA